MEARRTKGLCYSCPERYRVGHKCKRRHIFLIEVGEKEVTGTQIEQGQGTEAETEELTEISLHAISGTLGNSTMKVEGEVNNKRLQLLIDSGSTHNFLDESMTDKLGCRTEQVALMKVLVANDSEICSRNFVKLTMKFVRVEELCELKSNRGGSIQLTYLDKMTKLLSKKMELASIQLCSLSLQPSMDDHPFLFSASIGDNEEDCKELTELLACYEDVFKEPQGLPPTRTVDHRIPLKEGSTAMTLRPYQYPTPQNDMIERMVREMLMSGIIRPSSSPFSSPIILVKKKDQTWCMCIDYRRLIHITIKDKFMIPLVDELLNELHGVSIFFRKST